MYSFLVLLPLTLISAALGGILIFSPQVRDYMEYLRSLDGDGTQLSVQLAVHVVAYAIACFALVVTTRTVSAPVSSDRPDVLCRLQKTLEAIFVAVPSVTIIALSTYANVRWADFVAGTASIAASSVQLGPPEMLFWTAAGWAALALLCIVFTGRPQHQRGFERSLVAIVGGVPVALLIVLLLGQAASGAPFSRLLALTAGVGAVGLMASVAAVVLVRRPLELFRSRLRPLSVTLVDLVAGLAVAAFVGLAVSFMLRPVDAASLIGMFPVLFLISSVGLIIVAAVFARGASPVAIVSTAISAMVVMHALDWLLPTREFRYRSEIPAALQAKTGPLSVREVEKARGIMGLREAFLAWLQVRRPAIEAYRSKGRTYPVLVIAAQGGGTYAAYHSALSLARLYDSCPEIVNHVFVLSGVSGGALGSAVFAELVRSVPEGLRSKPGDVSDGCNPRPGAPRLEERVKAFFTADFLSPVVNSAMVFDIPSLLVPWLRLGMDRAHALEYGFESAWRRTAADKGGSTGKSPPYGMKASFYGRWTPDGPAPALFLGATGVNSGVPVLVSQINWAQGQGLRLGRTAIASGREDEVDELLGRAQAQSERARSSVITNILSFRPDLQMATSTAVALSARFPYVTPPANIKRSTRIEPPTGFYNGIKVLELLDGAYFDNSGGWVAIDLLEDLERYMRPRRWSWGRGSSEAFKEFADDIRFHLVRFIDRPTQRRGSAAEDEHFELLTPLIAFNTVRAARGAQLRGVRDLDRTGETFIYLSDPWFTPSLNWLLSQDTKANIELRSGGAAGPEHEVCCRMIRSAPQAGSAATPGTSARAERRRRSGRGEILLEATWEEAQKLNDHPVQQRARASTQATWVVEKFVPNNGPAFDTLLTLVKEGDERTTAVAAN